MASNLNLTNAIVTAQAQVIADALDNGYLRLYSGTQPASADTAVSGQVKLAELRFAVTAEASIANGVITFAALTPDSSAVGGDTATWFRAVGADGTTVVIDGTVGISASDLNMNAVAILAGAAVSVSTMTYTVVK